MLLRWTAATLLILVGLIGCSVALHNAAISKPPQDSIMVTVHSMNTSITRVIFRCRGDYQLGTIYDLAFGRTAHQRIRLNGCRELTVDFEGPVTESQVAPSFTPYPLLMVQPGDKVDIDLPVNLYEAGWSVSR